MCVCVFVCVVCVGDFFTCDSSWWIFVVVHNNSVLVVELVLAIMDKNGAIPQWGKNEKSNERPNKHRSFFFSSSSSFRFPYPIRLIGVCRLYTKSSQANEQREEACRQIKDSWICFTFGVRARHSPHHTPTKLPTAFTNIHFTCISRWLYGFFVHFCFIFVFFSVLLPFGIGSDRSPVALRKKKHVNKSQTHKILDFQLRKDKMSTVPYLSSNLCEREMWWNCWAISWVDGVGGDGFRAHEAHGNDNGKRMKRKS